MAQDSIVGGLFGLTPEMYQQGQRERERAEALQFAQLSPIESAKFGMYQAGQQLGRGIGSLLGVEDPQLKMIAQQQQILRNVDPNDPQSLAQGARMASEMGNARLASALAEQQRKVLESASLVAQRVAAATREKQTAIPTNIQEAQYVATLRNNRNQIAALPDSEEKTAALANIDAQLSQLVKPEKPESRSELQKLLDELALLDPVKDKQKYDALRGRINILTTREPRASVSVTIPPQEKSEQGKRGEMLVQEYKDISNAAKLAIKSLPSLQIQEGIIDAGFKTGFGAPAQKAAASVLGALGITDAEKFATNAQTFYSASQGAVLQKQLEQKGPQTESDAQRITATGAQLGNTPEANKFIINVAKAQFKRDIKQRNFYDDWWSKNKTYDGAENAWMTGEGTKSLFDYPELKAYKIGKEGSGAASTWRVVK